MQVIFLFRNSLIVLVDKQWYYLQSKHHLITDVVRKSKKASLRPPKYNAIQYKYNALQHDTI